MSGVETGSDSEKLAAWRSGETHKAADEKRPKVPRSELEDAIKDATQTPEAYLKKQIAEDGGAVEEDKLQPV